MKRLISALICIILCIQLMPAAFAIDTEAKIMPDTWAATDGLGRTLPCASDTKKKDDSKYVGMFYWTWHTNFARNLTAKNVTEILKEHPEIIDDFNSPLWESESSYPNGRPFFWDEPVWGYYSDLDEYVLRKNAELLADAGVDVIFFDCTNGTATWDDACEKLFEVFVDAKSDGVNVPKVAYILPFSADEDSTTSLKHLYNDIYSKGRYKDLWFMWEDKPLIMAHSSQLNKKDKLENEILNFFTFRRNDPSYFSSDKHISKKVWGWCSDYPQTKFGWSLRGIEQMTVSVAQNAADGKLCAQNADGNVQGRSFTHGRYSYTYEYAGKKIKVNSKIENSDFYGLNFQQQWDYAIKKNPDFIFVDGWNEWIAGRWDEWMGTYNAFPDQFSPEHSRDIEPSNGRLKDYYYYQLVSNIRRYKGISDKTIENDGVKTYFHYTDSTRRRDCDGWKGLHYTENTMRNDFTRADVYTDGKTVFMTIETKNDITPYTDNAWMRILFDTDKTGLSENWEGFEYIVNRENASPDTLVIEKSTGGWNFKQTGTAKYTVNGNKMTCEIPVSALGLENNVEFRFKLSDNMQNDGDIMDFYKSGDVAPGGRFTFVFENEQVSKHPVLESIKSFFNNIGQKIRDSFNRIFKQSQI